MFPLHTTGKRDRFLLQAENLGAVPAGTSDFGVSALPAASEMMNRTRASSIMRLAGVCTGVCLMEFVDTVYVLLMAYQVAKRIGAQQISQRDQLEHCTWLAAGLARNRSRPSLRASGQKRAKKGKGQNRPGLGNETSGRF